MRAGPPAATRPRRLLRAGAWLPAIVIVAMAGGRAVAGERVVVQLDSPMRHLANFSDPGIGADWTSESFDDRLWTPGAYGVGYETSPPGATTLLRTTVPAGAYSVYTRATFAVEDVSMVTKVTLGADYDDGWVAWINGVEVARSPNMPAGNPEWNTNAGAHESSNGAQPQYDPILDVSAAALPALHDGVNMLAIGVWNTNAPASTDLVVVPRLALSDPVIRGPYLQLATPGSVIVRWRTNGATDSAVRYGASPGAPERMGADPTVTTEHVVLASGLAPGTRYYYSVGSTAAPFSGGDADHFFTTPPETGTSPPLLVWALGDSGTADSSARAVRDGYLAYSAGRPTDLWLMLGDNAYQSGTEEEYQHAVFETYPGVLRQSPLWPAFGNHDSFSSSSATQSGPYYDAFSLPAHGEAGGATSNTEAYYSFNFANIHFVCLDSADSNRLPGGPMLAWLEQDLATVTADWIVAFWHAPPYSKGSHDSDAESDLIEMRENVMPILEDRGVDLVLTAHSHAYERSYLIDGHYGPSNTFTDAMKLNGGDGRIDGDGAYAKPSAGHAPHQGAVHVVAGASGVVRGGPFGHPVMYTALETLGSVALEVRGRQLDVKFLDDHAAIRDYFTIAKGAGAPPQADFAAVPVSGAAPLTVAFDDRSSKDATVWRWDFENDDAFDSAVQRPSHVYAAAGLYSVRLRAMSGFGADDEVKSQYICVLSANGSSDVDGDSVPDGVDVCPCAADPSQADADADGRGDACDCAPLDPAAFAGPPAEVAGPWWSRGAGGRPLLEWVSQGGAIVYDLATGDIDAMRRGGGVGGAACLAEDLASNVFDDPRADPTPGAGYYYLVRAQGARCGAGTYGASSSGAERAPAAACF